MVRSLLYGELDFKIMVMKKVILLVSALLVGAFMEADACTGISLTAKDGSRIVARTVEWSESAMDCGYAVAPRGHMHQSLTPTGENGLKYKSLYGYVGIYTEYAPFIVEGMNESGLSAGLFFFPQYGEYMKYDQTHNDKTLCDMQFVSWVLSQFSSIDQVKAAVKEIDLVSLDSRIGTVHWRIAEPGGRMVVLEFVGGKPHFYENPLGVLTNSPGFEWQMMNLNNYVNLVPGAAPVHNIADGVELKAFGGGSGMLGLPGDFTPPSRFVRAAFFQATAPVQATGFDAVTMAFHILNNFDVPVGVQNAAGKVPEGLPSATQFTSATDQKALKLYYRTVWNSNVRCIDLMYIDFNKVHFQTHPLDAVKQQPVEMVKIR